MLQLHYFDLLWIFVQFVSAVVQQWTGFRLEQRITLVQSFFYLRPPPLLITTNDVVVP